jgi:biopolymer transport protein ExbD
MGKLAIAALGWVLLALPGCPALAQAPNDGLSRQPLLVEVLKDGKVFIRATEVPWSELGQRLVVVAKSGGYSNGSDVFLRADKSVEYGLVMRAMTAIKNAGFNKIIIVVP